LAKDTLPEWLKPGIAPVTSAWPVVDALPDLNRIGYSRNAKMANLISNFGYSHFAEKARFHAKVAIAVLPNWL
jgi:hypothetical protein